jgi:hypothetical protein
VIAFHGTADNVVGFELAEAPCTRAADAGVRCDLVPYEGIGHPAIDPAFFDLLGDIERRTVEFIAEVVLEPLGYIDEPVPPTSAPPPAPSTEQPPPPAVPVVRRPTYTG